MRVLVTGLPCGKGGIGTLIYNIALYNRQIDTASSIEFEFLVPKGSQYTELLCKENYTCHECPNLKNFIAYYKTIKKVFSGNTYDYAWINNTSRVDIIVPLLAKKHGTQVIQHSHGIDTEERGMKRMLFLLLEQIYGAKYDRLIDIPVACSVASADYFYQNKGLRERCTILSNGIFAENFRYNEKTRTRIRQELDMDSTTVLLGAVGRLTAVKNYSFLINVLSKLPTNYSCVVLGDGEERESLIKRINDEGMRDRFFLLGNKSNVSDYLSAMDIFVMPSLNEGMPFSVIEAQTSGLKCVCSTGISEEVNITGNVLFADISDVNSWIGALTADKKEIYDRTFGYEQIKKQGFSVEETYIKFAEIMKGD